MRMHRDPKVEAIRAVPLFAHCSEAQLAEISSIADEIDLRVGRQLTREGTRGQEFVVILDGTADVRKHDEVVAQLGSGDYFGEIALLTGVPRTATVVATTSVHALIIEGHAFQRLLEHSPELRQSIEVTSAERQAAAVHEAD